MLMKVNNAAEVQPVTIDLGGNIRLHRKAGRKFARVHVVFANIKMPKEQMGYMRPRKFEHY